ncbi:OmpP1/FadL family transporter [Natronogracilivirga saccharolytica]|uniref:Outer membrane protein transport protein n=1 Tax=Natronogracilivirga saccharolytica TaxID=2812953 RepID=A0A8J7UVH1_9BACT|nr:outer membrane protein transport protein [Natronogracilivirga saccharolytica]MBP3192541.1 outer membrane protein transport protein [Natronogracilivirga saccharolytica]
MKNIVTVLTAGLLAVCLAASAAMAGGYQLNLLGQRQIGMGHVGTGMPLDIATIAMNPGGLSALDGNAVMAGSNATFISTAYRAPAPSTYQANTDSRVRTPFSIYASYDTPVDNLKAGFAVYTPYGNALKWEEGWKYRTLLREISLTSIYLQPTLSYAITDNIGVGAGFIYAIGMVNLQRDLPISDMDGHTGIVELDGSTTAIGFNAGIYADVTDLVSLGVSYRSEIEMEVEGGDADFTIPQSLQGNFPEGNRFDASLPLPAVLNIGVGLTPTERLRVGIDANLTFWSAYESLDFAFEENTPALQNITEPRNFNDRWIFRLGGEFDATEALQLRLGGYFDPSPVDEGFITPETPDLDRIGMSAGVGYAFTPDLGVNASLLFITSSPREQSLEDTIDAGTFGTVPVGEFKTRAWLPGISLYHKF